MRKSNQTQQPMTTWNDTTTVRRTMMSLPELLIFGVGRGKRDLRSVAYCGEYCPTLNPTLPSSSTQSAALKEACSRSLRSAQFELPERSRVPYVPTAPSNCDAGIECPFSHSALETFFHFENYKRYECVEVEHLSCYPQHVRREMGLDDTVAALPMTDAAAVQLQRCPLYHSHAERDAWRAWRQAYAGFAPWSTASYHGCQRLLGNHSTFQALRVAVQSYASAVVQELQRVGAGEVSVLVVQPLDTFVLASLMDAPCTHEVLCFLQFVELALPEVALVWPDQNTSGNLRVEHSMALPVQALVDAFHSDDLDGCFRRGNVVVLDPLATAVETLLSDEHLAALATWLLRVEDQIQNCGTAHQFLNVRFFPHCTSEPFAHSVPHKYYHHLKLIANVLKEGWRGPRDSQLGDIVVRPLSFFEHVADVVLLAVAHWLSSVSRWIKKRSVCRNTIELFLGRPPAAS